MSKDGENTQLDPMHFQMIVRPPQGSNSYSKQTSRIKKNSESARALTYYEQSPQSSPTDPPGQKKRQWALGEENHPSPWREREKNKLPLLHAGNCAIEASGHTCCPPCAAFQHCTSQTKKPHNDQLCQGPEQPKCAKHTWPDCSFLFAEQA